MRTADYELPDIPVHADTLANIKKGKKKYLYTQGARYMGDALIILMPRPQVFEGV